MTTATAVLDVHLILRNGDEILCALRAGDAYGSGEWALPCGKVNPGESLPAAAVREAYEELGVTIDPADLTVGHTVHGRHDVDHIGVFFEVRTWSGTLTNREPEKCTALRWFPATKLPAPIMDYSAAGLRGYFAAPGGLSTFGGDLEAATLEPAATTTARHEDSH
ncbi:NUDIX domain-containing protein [Streptomyces sp. NPDC058751]|uniref:NUDIX hydrolase n=1 Tax=Streptomyces sp. NPDC058751 TaxID=3346623 RepID=UPI0036B0E620